MKKEEVTQQLIVSKIIMRFNFYVKLESWKDLRVCGNKALKIVNIMQTIKAFAGCYFPFLLDKK